MAIVNGTIGNDTLNGTDSQDVIRGFAGNDVLYGLGGDDVLDGGTGADTMDGGSGNDWYYVDNLNDVVIDSDATNTTNTTINTSISTTVNFDLSTVGTNKLNLFLYADGITGTGSSGNDLILSYANNTTLIGGAGYDILKGGYGSVLRGGADDDVLEITNGNTGTLIGGSGNDTYNVYSTSGNLVIDELADGGSGIDTVFSLVDFNLGNQPGVTFRGSIENLTLAVLDVTPGDKLGGPITGTGNNLDNLIIGNRQDNFLYGLNGNDTIYASDGNDYVDGGYGNDSLYGEVGNDTLVGGPGVDTMVGGVGNDTYYVDNISDVVIENKGEGTDTVYTTSSWSTSAEVEAIHVTGTNAVNITLNNTVGTRIDIVSTSMANDVFAGGSGNDTLNGGLGIDQLTGGAGSDTFEFGGAGLSVGGFSNVSIRQDIITDFTGSSGIGQGDKIRLDKTNTFTALIGNGLGGLGAGEFVSGNFGVNNTDMDKPTAKIVYNTYNGALLYNADGSAFGYGTDGGFFATLSLVASVAPTLTVADFTIV